MQVAGKSCLVCDEKIVTIHDGLFCRECRCCFHCGCVAGSRCPECDGSLERPQRATKDWRREALATRPSAVSRISPLAVVLIVLPVTAAAIAIWIRGEIDGFRGLFFYPVTIFLGLTLVLGLVLIFTNRR